MQLINKRNLISFLLLFFSFLGFIDSTYLAVMHYKNIIPPCSIAQGCEKVLTSKFSEFLGTPVSLLGSVYFVLLIVLFVLLFQKRKRRLAKILLILTFLGVSYDVFLFFIQEVVLKAFCQYCLFAETIIFIIFAVLIFYIKDQELKLT